MKHTLPLAKASERLRRPPGRPRKAEGTQGAVAQQASALGEAPEIMAVSESVVSGLYPRLLDL